jgi:putative acetyltransferase
MVSIARESPVSPDLALLFQRHTEAMFADTPPESIHMLDAGDLDADGISFYVMRESGKPIGMGAFMRLDAGHAEIKSMHVLREMRGRGLARLMLDHLIKAAQAAGHHRLSLETGSQPGFLAARRLYERAGFSECAPFGTYVIDPNSVYMTRHS